MQPATGTLGLPAPGAWSPQTWRLVSNRIWLKTTGKSWGPSVWQKDDGKKTQQRSLKSEVSQKRTDCSWSLPTEIVRGQVQNKPKEVSLHPSGTHCRQTLQELGDSRGTNIICKVVDEDASRAVKHRDSGSGSGSTFTTEGERTSWGSSTSFPSSPQGTRALSQAQAQAAARHGARRNTAPTQRNVTGSCSRARCPVL